METKSGFFALMIKCTNNIDISIPKWQKIHLKAELLIGAMTIWGVLMLISRVRLGMHYPIDLFVAIISAWIVHLIIFGFLQKKGLFNNK